MIHKNPKLIALVGGKLYSDPRKDALRDAAILVDAAEGTIRAAGPRNELTIPTEAEVISCDGSTVTAGFWNCHVHFFERKWANAAEIPATELARQLEDTYARYGATSIFDLSSDRTNTRKIRERIESGEVSGPRIFTTGEGLVPPGAVPPEIVSMIMGVMKVAMPEVNSPSEAAAAAKNLIESGVDAVKIFASGPRSAPMSRETMQAAVDVAHAAAKQVFVHPNSVADIRTAVEAGVDVVAHTTPRGGETWDDRLLSEMLRRNVAVTPTLTIWKYFARHDRVSAQDATVATECAQLGAWHRAGGEVLFGTDLGAVDPDPAEEYRLMARAGMNWREILESLTTAPARRFGGSATLEPGAPADLVVLDGNPEINLDAFSRVKLTMRGGNIAFRA